MQIDIEYTVRLPGHITNLGRDAGKEKNIGYINDNNNGDIVTMDCNSIYTQIDKCDWNYIQNINGEICTWYKLTVGYVGAHYKKWSDGIDTIVYLHDYILSKYEPKPGPDFSVDHINGDKLDNRHINLRWATQSLQNKNMDKRTRKHNAKPLPDGLDIIISNCKQHFNRFNVVDKSIATAFQLWVNSVENVLPKYVEYCDEIYNKEKGLRRQFFRINKHPSQQSISSSKSGIVSLEEKFNDIIQKLILLEHST